MKRFSPIPFLLNANVHVSLLAVFVNTDFNGHHSMTFGDVSPVAISVAGFSDFSMIYLGNEYPVSVNQQTRNTWCRFHSRNDLTDHAVGDACHLLPPPSNGIVQKSQSL